MSKTICAHTWIIDLRNISSLTAHDSTPSLYMCMYGAGNISRQPLWSHVHSCGLYPKVLYLLVNRKLNNKVTFLKFDYHKESRMILIKYTKVNITIWRDKWYTKIWSYGNMQRDHENVISCIMYTLHVKTTDLLFMLCMFQIIIFNRMETTN